MKKYLIGALAIAAANALYAGDLFVVGEIKERFETLDGMNKKVYGDAESLKGDSDDRLLVSRLNFGFIYNQSPDVTWKAIGYYADVFGWSLEHDDFKKTNGSQTYWENPQQDLDFSDLNVEIKNLAGVSGLSTKIGRMSNRYGDKRVLGPGSWGNAYGWLWDLAKLSYKWDGNFIDAFYGQTKDKDINRLSIINKHVFEGAGIYSHFKTNKKGAIEPFIIYKNGLYDEVGGNGENTQKNYTYGFRAFDKDLYSFNYDVTYAKADGTIKTKDYDAYAYVAKVGYKFKDITWKPNIVVGQVFASGDSDPKDGTVKTFRTPFGGTDGGLYGRMDIMRLNNMVENLVELHVDPTENMHIKLSYHDFSLDEANDTWAYYKKPNLTTSTELGQEYDVQYKWQYNKDLEFQAIYAYFDAGKVVTESVSDNDAQRLFLQVHYKFKHKM